MRLRQSPVNLNDSLQVLRAHITDNLVTTIKCAEGSDQPYSHLYFTQLFPKFVYDWILKNPPNFALFNDLYHPDAKCRDGTSTRKSYVFNLESLDQIPTEQSKIWRAIYQSLQSNEVKSALFKRLATDLSIRFKMPIHQLETLDNKPRTSFIQDLEGYRIDPHQDISSKHVTMQIYLPENLSQRSLGTTIYRQAWRGKSFYWFKKRSRLLPRAWRNALFLRKVRTFKFLPNSGYAFSVSQKSWHGRSRIPNGQGGRARNSIMHIYYG